MPQTTTLENPGCPPLRALIVEARSGQNGGAARMAERWGDPDSSKCVLAASILDRQFDALLGIAQKCGSVEVISAMNGDLHMHIPEICQSADSPEDDATVGLHLFGKHSSESSSSILCRLHLEGSFGVEETLGCHMESFQRSTGNIKKWLCSDQRQKGRVLKSIYGTFKIVLRSRVQNLLGIFTPTWFTSTTFLSKDDHRKFVAGTNAHQVRLYDISAQRKPTMSIDFRETPIKAVAEDLDGKTIYIGNGSGEPSNSCPIVGKLVGCFIGKCSGSIRSIARRPELPLIASCGLDSYLHIWDLQSRQLLSAVFLKQHLSGIVFDSHFH